MTPAQGSEPRPETGPVAVRDRPTGTARKARAWRAAVLAAAVGAVLLGLLGSAELPADATLSPLGRLAVVAGVFALAQLLRTRAPGSSGGMDLDWGVAALVVALYLAPAGWLPAAALVGVGAALTMLAVLAEPRAPADVLFATAAVTLAVAVAAAVVRGLADPLLAAPTVALIAALTVGAVVYLAVTTALIAVDQSWRRAVPVRRLLRCGWRGQPVMFVANVTVGLGALVAVDRQPYWLLLLPPALWLLHQTYGQRLRADDERRTWAAFAQATRELNQLDEEQVATAGARGGVDLFAAERVEVEVLRGDGSRHRYAADATGAVTAVPPEPVAGPGPGDGAGRPAPAAAGWAVRPLVVGEHQVGELRVRFPSPAPGARDEMALSAYSDALAGALRDVATHRQLRQLAERASRQTQSDPLTGLANRAALLVEGDLLLRGLERGRPVALLLLDINHFKEVNETLGHGAGDELLQATAGTLSRLARPGELLARLGDDEFALLVPCLPVLADAQAGHDGAGELQQALRRAREINKLLGVPIGVAGVQLVVEVSVGVVVAPAGTVDMAELVRRADIAMHQAQAAGTSIAAYDQSRDAVNTDRLALLAELREALEAEDQLVLVLQPAVDLGSGAATGVEALIRWRHPRRGMLLPGEFLRPVEHSELLWPFTRYVIDRALGAAAAWAAEGIDLPVSVNLSARSLLDPGLAGEVAELLRRHRVPARNLVLEITETVVMSAEEVIDEVLNGLRALGVQLSVDDFGTGYSSLTFLTRVAVDELKIDRSFVAAMADSTQAAAIVRTTVELARGLGLRVVAEGVETADQRSALVKLGCAAAQGYHFCKPVPVDQLLPTLRTLGVAAPAPILPLRADGAS